MNVHGIARDTVVDERYRVLNRIGSGGMADVYCAEDLQLGRRVALKLLYRRFAEDEEFVERFRREASSAAGLQHPNVVAVYDRGEFDGTYYIAMEYLEGRSLKQVVRQDGALEPDRAIDLVIQILKAARFAHRRGIVHRDIKPHNVIVDDEGRAKVTDFGIARAGASDMTETGSIMGTAQYLSPEQAQGHPVDARADLYSIGVVLYELLTGRVPFDAESAVTIALKQVSEEPVPPSQLNPAISAQLEDVVTKALQKDPAYRFADADEFIRALEAVRGVAAGTGEYTRIAPHTGTYPGLPGPLEEPRRRSLRWLWILLTLLALAAIGVGAYLVLVPKKVAVPDVVGRRSDIAAQILQNRGFEPKIENVRSDSVPAGPGRHAAPAAAPAGQGGLDRDDHRLQRAGRRHDPVRPRQAARAGRAAAEGGGLPGRRAARVQRGRAAEPRDRDLAVGALAARARADGDARRLARRAQGPGARRRGQLEGRGANGARAARPAASRWSSARTRIRTLARCWSRARRRGQQIKKGGTVTLTVAKAPPQVKVPDVIGETSTTRRRLLEAAGFRVRRRPQTVDTPDDDGVVLDQNPPSGEKRDKGSRVILTVGRFKPPNLDPEPSGTPTPSPTP